MTVDIRDVKPGDVLVAQTSVDVDGYDRVERVFFPRTYEIGDEFHVRRVDREEGYVYGLDLRNRIVRVSKEALKKLEKWVEESSSVVPLVKDLFIDMLAELRGLKAKLERLSGEEVGTKEFGVLRRSVDREVEDLIKKVRLIPEPEKEPDVEPGMIEKKLGILQIQIRAQEFTKSIETVDQISDDVRDLARSGFMIEQTYWPTIVMVHPYPWYWWYLKESVRKIRELV